MALNHFLAGEKNKKQQPHGLPQKQHSALIIMELSVRVLGLNTLF